jgi:hypothetical protein
MIRFRNSRGRRPSCVSRCPVLLVQRVNLTAVEYAAKSFEPEIKTMTQKMLMAFWLSLVGGLWMLLSDSYIRFNRMPTGWGLQHMMWGRGMMGHLGMGWPWFGTIAGVMVVIIAIPLYSSPQHRRSLGTTILIVSLLNLFLSMSGLLGSLLGIAGGIVALSPRRIS